MIRDQKGVVNDAEAIIEKQVEILKRNITPEELKAA